MYVRQTISDATKDDYTRTSIEVICQADELEISVVAGIVIEKISDNTSITPGIVYAIEDNLVWIKEKLSIREVKKFIHEFLDKNKNQYVWLEDMHELI